MVKLFGSKEKKTQLQEPEKRTVTPVLPGKFRPDMHIGEVIEAHPGAEKVIEKYFGSGCFTCPGIRMESISFGAMMHGVSVEAILKELNELK